MCNGAIILSRTELWCPKAALFVPSGEEESVPVLFCSCLCCFLSHSPVPDYLKSTVETTMKIHQMENDGDILAFLTGQV